MDPGNIFTSVFALVFVLCLIGLASVLLRKYGSRMHVSTSKGAEKRLQVKEVLHIDAKKKVILISRDDKEHLIAFSGDNIEVIENL